MPQRSTIDDYDLDFLAQWSIETFGPGIGADGVIDHLKKELTEVEDQPDDLEEWIDIIMLAMDGARKGAGATPHQILQAWHDKFEKNRNRQWPDWRTVEPGKAIEHLR